MILMNSIRREWREDKVRPIPGNSPHDRPVSRVISSSPRRVCDDPFSATLFRCFEYRGPQYAFFRHGGIYLVRWGWQSQTNPNPGAEPTASRWSAPRPGQRTRREEHAPSHRPQMSSDRLFLDRVGRHQSPSPLHRHEQNNMHSSSGLAKGDISTLLARGHFYFALTVKTSRVDINEISNIEFFKR